MNLKTIFCIVFLTFCFSCSKQKNPNPLFVLKNNTEIDFSNTLVETEKLNPYTYKNFYNGGGVALGDINNDGLLDIYFSGNLVNNKLYLNQGNWQFIDITEKAGVACKDSWSSGVSFVDINHDGFLDIYVCKAGPPKKENRHNQLFINNGDSTFTEQSKKYGLDITGLGVQANFFDYDKDGDLDCYLLNNSIRSVGNYDLIKNQREKSTEKGNKLLRNDDGVFVDVTKEANIYSSEIGFGLGITVSDYNNDTWPDIFISNDFFERDYLYVNQQNGTFKEDLTQQFQSISMGSMGADAADVNNDSKTDIMVTEMLPKTIERQRTKTLFESWNKYDLGVKNGYHYQFSRNALHQNIGNNTFLEISRFSNVFASEWSWSSLLFDADNDGLKDIFISNGIYKDLLDRDYLNYMANEEQVREMIQNDSEVMKKLINLMPSQAVPNVIYKNNGHFQFTDQTEQWGLQKPSFSNGSAYGDLDNDGDLDVVINNVNMPAFIYENTLDTTKYKSITLQLKGHAKNTQAIGAKAEIFYNTSQYSVLENFPSRGFQSSVSTHLTFGVDNCASIDSLKITWTNGSNSIFKNLKTNTFYTFNQPKKEFKNTVQKSTFPVNPLKETSTIFNFTHKENKAVDFNREQLLPEMFNNEGPHIASADINNDGNPDFYIGGAKGTSGKLFISQKDNTYKEISKPFDANYTSEDTDAVFFDSDTDGDLDLYVCSGGKSFSKYDFSLHDRLYINDGNQNFTQSKLPLPFKTPISSSTVSIYDFDQDGDNDIFVGERFKVTTYGIPANGYLLENKGNNTYKISDQTALESLGLITDSAWEDINNDRTKDLIVSGEWMPITIFINKNGKLINKTKEFGFANSSGFWKTFKMVDIDADGDVDIIAGNKGENTFFKAPMRMYISDFDSNGTIEQIICYKKNNNYYPIVDRDELVAQIANLKQKLLYYKDYANATISSIFSKEQLKNAIIKDIHTVQTTAFINNGNTFTANKLPNEIQYSNVAAIETLDLNNDGNIDILFGGNQYLVKPQFGRQDASQGWLLYGNNDKNIFGKVVSLQIKGQIRDFKFSKINQKKYILTAINNDSLKFFRPFRPFRFQKPERSKRQKTKK
ncbi:MAG: VCBS repeat-containing protein [Polaribacter sp.]